MLPLIFVLGLAQCYEQKKYTTVVAFGDSMSDSGNLYRLTHGRRPNDKYYVDGRFSNGPTWVEYLAKKINATLVNNAYGAATTDTKRFPAPNSPGFLDIPGCIQQVEQFVGEYAGNPDETLATVVFLGNDFVNEHATAESYVDTLQACISNLITGTGINNILVATTSAPELAPNYDLLQEYMAKLPSHVTMTTMVRDRLNRLRQEHPAANFFEADFRAIAFAVANKQVPLSGSGRVKVGSACANPKYIFFFDTYEMMKCTDPEDYMFWDGIHPTTHFHRVIGESFAKLI